MHSVASFQSGVKVDRGWGRRGTQRRKDAEEDAEGKIGGVVWRFFLTRDDRTLPDISGHLQAGRVGSLSHGRCGMGTGLATACKSRGTKWPGWVSSPYEAPPLLPGGGAPAASLARNAREEILDGGAETRVRRRIFGLETVARRDGSRVYGSLMSGFPVHNGRRGMSLRGA